MKTTILFGSNTGKTTYIANLIKNEFDNNVDLYNIKDINASNLIEINKSDYFVFGTCTWGIGDLQDDVLAFDFKKLDLKNKKASIFALGDSQVYGFTFCDSIQKLHKILLNRKAIIVGEVDAKNYNFVSSKSIKNGFFMGLALDEVNESHLSMQRIKNWVANLKKIFI